MQNPVQLNLHRRHTSVTTWVSASMFGVLVAFAFVMGVNLRAHRQTAHALRVLAESYLPLSLMVSEARANAGVYSAMLLRADDAGVREWLEAAAEIRAVPLSRAERKIQAVIATPAYRAEVSVLAQLQGDLQRSRALLQQSHALIVERTAPGWAQRVTPIEAENARLLRRIWDHIDHRLREISLAAEAQEQASVQAVAILSALFLALGIAAALLIRNLLKPLPRLAQRMQRVETGELRAEAVRVDGARTELTELAEQFEAMVASLSDARAKLVSSERLAAVGKMAAHVAHEVRNPLSSIGLNVELLAEEVDTARAPEAQKLLTSIQKEIERLTEITREYLTFARIPVPKRNAENVFEVCHEAVELVKGEFAKSGVRVHVEAAPEVRTREFPLDENQIRQVLLNLLRNAKDAHANEVTVRVDFPSDGDSGGGVVVDVVDNGGGIATDVAARLFEPFLTTKERGTGLGLALSRQIVEAHGGTLSLATTSAQGSVFRVQLTAQSAGHSPS